MNLDTTDYLREVQANERATRAKRFREAVDAVNDWVEGLTSVHEAAVVAARRAGKEPPRPDLPRAESAFHVRAAAKKLELPDAFMPLGDADQDEDLRELVDQLRALPEFSTIKTAVLDVRWWTKAVGRKDGLVEVVRAGATKLVPKDERETWTGEGEPPWFRVSVSLPWWLLATYEERQRGLHDLLMACAVDSTGPRLRKPDIVAHAATLGRFGVGDVREARAVLHAAMHPDLDEQLRAYEYDRRTGQGLMWPQLGGGH